MEPTTLTRRFSREEYYQMGRTGILRSDERVELLHGEIYPMTPQGTRHAAFLAYLDAFFQRNFGDHVTIRAQLPLVFGEHSEPEPDLAVVPGQPLDYAHHHPPTALLIVEIAEISLAFDRTTKAQLYAEHQISEYWIVNIPDRQLEIHRDPSPSGYQSSQIIHEEESASPMDAPTCTLHLSHLFSSLD